MEYLFLFLNPYAILENINQMQTIKVSMFFSLLGPIIELQEIELLDLWGVLDDQEVCEEFGEKLVLSQTEISEGEILAYQPASVVKSAEFEENDLDGDTKHTEKSSFQEDIETARQSESASADRQEEDFPGSDSTGNSLSRDGEPGSEKQVEEEEFGLGTKPDTETNMEEDHPVSDREPGTEGQVSQEEDDGIAETTNTTAGPIPEATAMISEDTAVADMDVIASEQDAPVAEVVKETPARKESFSRQHGSQFGQQTSSETRLKDEDLLRDQNKGKVFSFILV